LQWLWPLLHDRRSRCDDRRIDGQLSLWGTILDARGVAASAFSWRRSRELGNDDDVHAADLSAGVGRRRTAPGRRHTDADRVIACALAYAKACSSASGNPQRLKLGVHGNDRALHPKLGAS